MRVDPLLEQYPVRIREVTLGVILGISILFYVFPRFLGEAKKVVTTVQQEIETFDILIESDDKILNKQSEIKLAITLNGKVTNYDFESYLNKIKIENITKLSESKFGSNIIEVKFIHNDKAVSYTHLTLPTIA